MSWFGYSSSSQSFSSSPGSFLNYNEIKAIVKRGDLIEIQRDKYKHWAICQSSEPGRPIWCYHISFEGPDPYEDLDSEDDDQQDGERLIDYYADGQAIIKYEPLKDILSYKWGQNPSLCRVNNLVNQVQQFMLSLGPVPDLNRVFAFLETQRNAIVKYHVTDMNCEHYVTLWKYGVKWSSQVNKINSLAFKIMTTWFNNKISKSKIQKKKC